MKIAVLGLGLMGGAIALRLKGEGLDIVGWNRSPEKARDLAEQGVTTVRSAREAVQWSQVVILVLRDVSAITETLFSPKTGNIIKGRVVLQMGTIAPEESRELAKRVEVAGGEYLESPVLGSLPEAQEGRLILMAGGERALFERCLPVLQVIGERITLLGPHGAGYAAKIAQVVLCYLHSLALSEALMLGVKGGVEVGQMLSIIQNSTGKSYVADRYGPPILNGDYDASFTLGLAHKDMKLAHDMARDLGIRLPMCELTTGTYARALDSYGFDANHLMAVRLLEEDNNTFLQACGRGTQQ